MSVSVSASASVSASVSASDRIRLFHLPGVNSYAMKNVATAWNQLRRRLRDVDTNSRYPAIRLTARLHYRPRRADSLADRSGRSRVRLHYAARALHVSVIRVEVHD